jgi:4-alpha-glucanotransferase
MKLPPEKRIAGVLVPLFALRTERDLGTGDLEGLHQFIDWAAETGFKVIQLLPINEMGADHSPYNAISAIALEPTTLHLAPRSPDDLSQQDFDEVVAQYDLPKLRTGAVKHQKVRKLKLQLLERAYASFVRRGEEHPAYWKVFQEFCRAESAWLDEYALFRALMEKNKNREAWELWPEEHRTIDAAGNWMGGLPQAKLKRFNERLMFHRYVQWIAYSQWIAARSHAESRGIGLMGDIPFGINRCSADVYARRDEFTLEWCGGAPPEPYFKDDEFTQKWGQNWGIPLYRWDIMRTRDFGWWRQRVRGVRKIFHLFRIDHVLGFYRIYAFPWLPMRNREFISLSWDEMLAHTGGAFPQFYPRDDSNWENCLANCREGEEYLKVVLQEAGDVRVIGEDLGTVPHYVRPSLRSLEVATFKIPQWENYDDGRSIPGREYQRLSVATYATHDHKPLRSLWQDAFDRRAISDHESEHQAKHTLAKIREFAGLPLLDTNVDFEKDFYPGVIEALFRSESWIAMLMISDLLGRKDRYNVPGTTARSNWSRRISETVSELGKSSTIQKRMKLIRTLLEKTGRISA